MVFERLRDEDIEVLPLGQRQSLIAFDPVSPSNLSSSAADAIAPQLDALVARIVAAQRQGASVVLVYGAHLVKNCLSPVVRALIEEGWVSHLATQGAGMIHDWELAFQGRTSESVKSNAAVGRFGSWDETGRAFNLAALLGSAEGMGLGEALGRFIADDGWVLPAPEVLEQQIRERPGDPLTAARADLLRAMMRFGLSAGRLGMEHPFAAYSIAAAAYRKRIPLTVHVGIGYDIITNHPMFHGGAIGRCSGVDTRTLAAALLNLTHGVYLSVGSAIMSPQVFEKALSAANNVRHRRGLPYVTDHYIAVVDLQNGGGWNWSEGEPPRDHPAYYLRFCKTFYRMGGTVDYIMGDNRLVLSELLARLRAHRVSGALRP